MTIETPTHGKNPVHDDFHRQLGELVFWFAASENLIFLLLGQLIGDKVVSRVMTRDLQLGKAIETARALAKAKHGNSPHHADFDRALLQFKKCAEDRNALLHSIVLPTSTDDPLTEAIAFVNARTATTFNKSKDHIAQLRATLRNCSMAFLQAGLDMGVFTAKKKQHGK